MLWKLIVELVLGGVAGYMGGDNFCMMFPTDGISTAELERDLLVNADRTSGRYVTTDTEKIKTLRAMLSSAFIEEMFTRLRELGLDDEEIRAAVNEWGYMK